MFVQYFNVQLVDANAGEQSDSSRLCASDREFHTHIVLHSNCARPN